MKMINLELMKIEDHQEIQTLEREFSLESSMSSKEIRKTIKDNLLKEKTELPTQLLFRINSKSFSEQEDFMLLVAQIFSCVADNFTEGFSDETARNRGFRKIPDNVLEQININSNNALLKRMFNYETKADVFTFNIICGEFRFGLTGDTYEQ